MELYVFRSLWGMTGPIEARIAQIAAEGYDGVETGHQPDVISASDLRMLLDRYHLKLTMGTTIDSSSQIEAMLSIHTVYQPLRLGVHAGRDSMSHDEGARFIEQALKIAQKIGIKVAFETHRGRIFYTPWDTAFYLQQFSDLHVVADFSHWVNVCERLPDDQITAINLACERTIHIHGRVGYEEGPQVPDPAAPEYATQREWHEARWQTIREAHQRRADSFLTFTPEYGPPGYMHTLPHTKAPVADLSTICLWAATRIRQQFASVDTRA